MPSEEYKQALDAACREYESLAKQKAELDQRIAKLVQTIGSLTRLCGYTPTVSFGLTDGCRMVLRAAGHPMTATEVRQQLEVMGFDMSKYSNDLAPIHTVLKRLTESGQAEFVARAWGRPSYEWRGAISDRPRRLKRKK
jgi:hypothetical protein